MLSINERNCHVNIMYVQTGTKYHTLHSGRKAVSFTNHNNKHFGLVLQNQRTIEKVCIIYRAESISEKKLRSCCQTILVQSSYINIVQHLVEFNA